MNILCNKQQLLEAIQNVQRAVAAKSAILALEGILLRAQGTTLYLAGYDLELGITTTIPATVWESGKMVLPARMFGDIVRKMPGDNITIISDEKLNTTIRNDVTEISIMGMSADEYPDIPKIDDGVSFPLSQPILKSMIRQTIFAVEIENDLRPIHTGTLFEITTDELKLISVDGYRIAMRTEPIHSEETARFVVPGKMLREILKLLTDEDKTCHIIVGRRHIIFEINGFAVISRLLDGEFMDYTHVIQSDVTSTITVNTRTFIDAVDRVSLVISPRLNSPLVCEFKNDSINISCNTPIGRANDSIDAALIGENETMGFKSHYLMDALKNSETDEVRVELNGAAKPMRILPKEGNSFLFLVLPVRLK